MLDIESIVYTINGPVATNAVAPDDKVCGSTGRFNVVDSVHIHEDRPIFRVVFEDGDSIKCTADHVWSVRNRRAENIERLTTQSIMDTLLETSGHPRWRVEALPGPVWFNSEIVPIESYLAAVLMQESVFDGSSISGDEGDYRESSMSVTGAKKLHVRVLRNQNLGGLVSTRKRIPGIYLWNTESVRKGFLQGLLDTGGKINPAGSVTHTTNSKAMAQDVKLLVQSLGGVASVNGSIRTEYRTIARFQPGFSPFRNKEKATRYEQASNGESPVRKIVSVQAVGSAKVVELEVGGTPFLTQGFVPVD